MFMLIVAFFSWWYGKGWSQVGKALIVRQRKIISFFSVSQLLTTLFSPWRRIISYPGASLGDKFRALVDNIFSRTIGFFVRLFVLIAALLLSIITLLLSILEFIIWPLLPPSAIASIIAGILL
jgi:hypothetical protein